MIFFCCKLTPSLPWYCRVQEEGYIFWANFFDLYGWLHDWSSCFTCSFSLYNFYIEEHILVFVNSSMMWSFDIITFVLDIYTLWTFCCWNSWIISQFFYVSTAVRLVEAINDLRKKMKWCILCWINMAVYQTFWCSAHMFFVSCKYVVLYDCRNSEKL